jgi:hypothetical protein
MMQFLTHPRSTRKVPTNSMLLGYFPRTRHKNALLIFLSFHHKGSKQSLSFSSIFYTLLSSKFSNKILLNNEAWYSYIFCDTSLLFKWFKIVPTALLHVDSCEIRNFIMMPIAGWYEIFNKFFTFSEYLRISNHGWSYSFFTAKLRC